MADSPSKPAPERSWFKPGETERADDRHRSVIENYAPRLVRFLEMRTGNRSDAQDLAQEAYLRLVALEDGSLIYVNTHSKVRVTYSDSERRVELVEGEGLFEVAHDPGRPFRVHAAGTVAQAVGTKFNVRHTPQGVSVVVMEGKVLVDRDRPPKTPPIRSRATIGGTSQRIAPPVLLLAAR